jgi:hypothetical protein
VLDIQKKTNHLISPTGLAEHTPFPAPK